MRRKASAAHGEDVHLWEQHGCRLSFCWSPGWSGWSGWCIPPSLSHTLLEWSCMLLLISTEPSRYIVYLRQLSSKDKQEESAKCIRKKQAGAHFSGYQHCLFSLIQTLPLHPTNHLQGSAGTQHKEHRLVWAGTALSMLDCFLLVLGRKWSESFKQLQTKSLYWRFKKKKIK